MNDKNFMQIAISEAKKSFTLGEVPIGAVVVKNGEVISKGHNVREKKQNALLHAEIVAIDRACKKLRSWRLDDCEIYVTLEPCPMCAGAIANARMKKIVYACEETTSQDHLCEKILSSNRLNHKCAFERDEVYKDEAAKILSDFFKTKRKN